MSKTTKSIIQFIVLLGVGVLLVWLSFRSVWSEKDKIIDSFKNANYFWVAVSMAISLLSHIIRSYRWNYLLKPLGYQTTKLNAFGAVMVGYFANYGLPRMGELTRCTLVKKYDDVPFEVALGTVITERIVDLLLLLIIFFLTLVAQFAQLKDLTLKYIYNPMMLKLGGITGNPVKLTVLIVVLVLFILAFFLLRKKLANVLKGKLGNIIVGFAKGLSSIKDMENKFQFIVLSLAIWACYFYGLYACFFAFDATANLGQSVCLALLLFGTFGVIFTPGGLGVYPAIIGGLLIYYGVEQITAFAFPWMAWTSQFILFVVFGLLSLILLPIINKSKTDVVSSETK